MSREPALVVSLHDVCPRTAAACRTILASLDRLGIRRRSLLVIPAEPGGEIDADPACARWLRDLAAAGDELVHHGWRHAPDPTLPPARGLAAWLDWSLARGAGEFLTLDGPAAAWRLADGRARLAAMGLPCDGFVAPAWLTSREAAAAVRAAGFRYLTTHLRLRDLHTGRDHWSFGISNRPGPLGWDLVGRGVNTALAAVHHPAPLLRIAIHPADLVWHRPFEHTLWLLRAALRAGRRPVTYRDYLDQRELVG